MKKPYSQPRTEAIEFKMEALMNATSGFGVISTDGLGDDVTTTDDKLTNFAKDHNGIWDFDEE